MTSFVIRCSNCGKPIVASLDSGLFVCPYCNKEVNAKKQRNDLLAFEAKEKRDDIRKMMDVGDYDSARDASLDAASSAEAKAIFLALVLECDLLRHHPFFFDQHVIEEDVKKLLSAKDFSELSPDEMEETQVSSLRALRLFYEKTIEWLNRHGTFAGERYDALSRFAYVGMCCLALKKTGAKSEMLAMECSQMMSNICSEAFGTVYNMPPEVFQEAERVVETLSHEFHFASSIYLQNNPHATDIPFTKQLICPICGDALSEIHEGPFMTCPACRHRISREAIQNASLCEEPISYQNKLERCVAKDDLQGAKEVLRFLRKKDPLSPDYALAELIVRREGITPLRLSLKGYPELLRLALSADVEAFQGQTKNTVERLRTIRSILLEASSLPHGPDKELIDALDQFTKQFA